MAPWIASFRADNAIELRHRELHQDTYCAVLFRHTNFPCARLEAAIASEDCAMRRQVSHRDMRGGMRGGDELPGSFQYLVHRNTVGQGSPRRKPRDAQKMSKDKRVPMDIETQHTARSRRSCKAEVVFCQYGEDVATAPLGRRVLCVLPLQTSISNSCKA